MEKSSSKRMIIGLIQHIFLALSIMLIIMMAQKSIIRIESKNGIESRFYELDLWGEEDYFEETQAFRDMFSDAVSDLTTLVVIKGQMETLGSYDGKRLVDITAFVNRKETVSNCPITAVYHLDDLIKWGKNGVDMKEYSMTKKEFVNFFGDGLLDVIHFYLDEDGELQYRGELDQKKSENGVSVYTQEAEDDPLMNQAAAEENAIKERLLLETYYNYLQYNEGQLVDLAFSYLVAHMDKPVTISTNRGEQELVHIEMLKPIYATAKGDARLIDIAGNWFDYCQLENNLIDTIESLAYNYRLYENWSKEYAGSNSNLSYLVRIPEGNSFTDYTNMSSEFVNIDMAELDNYYEDLGRYISYFVDDIECVGNVDITDEEMFSMVDTHKYAYPAGTRIWVGVDTDYVVLEDSFDIGQNAFNSLIPRVEEYLAIICVCLIIWLIIVSHLTYTAGNAITESGEKIYYLNGFDKLFTEFVVVIGVALVYAGNRAFRMLFSIAVEQEGYLAFAEYASDFGKPVHWYLSGIAALYGFLVSFCFSVIWYSLVRRLKSHNLWRDSFMNWLLGKVYKGATMVVYHKNTTVRTLIPYNIFLIANLCSFIMTYVFRERKYVSLIIMIVVLLMDAIVGMILFRQNAEMADIVETIMKIRKGEVDSHLEAEKLHGENREIAEAINNIGEGIKNAVETSMKDERMKADLITNVSHDIKTPLTSIINYVDLLKREKIQSDPVKTYIEILDSKSQRLKQLTDDLVEASKISSGNIILQKEKLNLTELINQAIGEFSEKFEEKNLVVVYDQSATEAYIYADSRRMWRIIENLFNNVCKYAMTATRVFIEVMLTDGKVIASIKNISGQQLNIGSQELTERFIRGDASRTTEGSGLGLYITKCLVEAQSGEFAINIDADLFKVTIVLPQYGESDSAKLMEERKEDLV